MILYLKPGFKTLTFKISGIQKNQLRFGMTNSYAFNVKNSLHTHHEFLTLKNYQLNSPNQIRVKNIYGIQNHIILIIKFVFGFVHGFTQIDKESITKYGLSYCPNG